MYLLLIRILLGKITSSKSSNISNFPNWYTSLKRKPRYIYVGFFLISASKSINKYQTKLYVFDGSIHNIEHILR